MSTEQSLKDIELLAKLLMLNIPENRPPQNDTDNPELAGLYLLRDDKPSNELMLKYPKQHRVLWFFSNREEIHGCRVINSGKTTIKDSLTKNEYSPEVFEKQKDDAITDGTLETDSALRISKDNKIWGITGNYLTPEEDILLMEGNRIQNFQQFLYSRFEPFLDLQFKGAINPFIKIVTINSTTRLSDLWDALDILKKHYNFDKTQQKAIDDCINHLIEHGAQLYEEAMSLLKYYPEDERMIEEVRINLYKNRPKWLEFWIRIEREKFSREDSNTIIYNLKQIIRDIDLYKTLLVGLTEDLAIEKKNDYEFNLECLKNSAERLIDQIEYESKKVKSSLPTQQKPLKESIFSSDTHTPPVSRTELATKLCINLTILSQSNRSFGAFFKKHCDEQNTETPCLPYNELWPLAREAVRRSSREGAEDLTLNDIEDLIKLWL